MPRAGLPLDSYCARLEKSGGSPARSEIRRTHQRVKSNTGRARRKTAKATEKKR
jgi:hypothetical protein